MYSFLPPSSHSPSFPPSLLLSLPPFLPPSSPPSLPSSANILLNQNWSGVLTDFGIARKLSLESTTVVTQRIVGTRVYMSPEYCTGLVSPSADVYSLGVVSTNISECVCVCVVGTTCTIILLFVIEGGTGRYVDYTLTSCRYCYCIYMYM